MSTQLSAAAFPEFFRALHGCEPFPWQSRLAHEVCETGRWPDLLDLPTGTGKTSAIDVAVLHLACEAEKGAVRRAPLRILFVVDRRIIVDAAYERAAKIAKALAAPGSWDVLRQVAAALALISADPESPLQVARLRGGTPRETDWARSASQPLVCVSTVDQIGSRLLFRGYGVSPRMWPVHAGLVGSDALWLLDEAHLAEPLIQTLGFIQRAHATPDGCARAVSEQPRLAPFGVVRLSATAGKEQGKRISLDEKDHADERLRRRLLAKKLARLEKVADLPAACVERAVSAAGLDIPRTESSRSRKRGKPAENFSPYARVVGVVVNRVDAARETFEMLRARLGDPQACERLADLSLLIGRCRPLDREREIDQLLPRMRAGRDRTALSDRPLIVVATQTIDVGADLDFDALITEVAPIDCLCQRFGRLDRLGEIGETSAWILATKEATSKDADDPVYGNRTSRTWTWLQEQAASKIDFGAEAMGARLSRLSSGPVEELAAPRPDAPFPFPAYVDLWATTSPAPAATPEPSLFLHGPARLADVEIVWRADVDPMDPDLSSSGLEACPPSALEALACPVWAVKAWLSGKDVSPIGDVVERPPAGEDQASGNSVALRFQQDEDRWSAITAEDVRPGDLIVVPCLRGGCDRWGWNPVSRSEVIDRGDEAQLALRGRLALRVTRATIANAFLAEASGENSSGLWRSIAAMFGEENTPSTIVREILAVEGLPRSWRERLEQMQRCEHHLDLGWYDLERPTAGMLLVTKKRVKGGAGDNDPSTERAASSFTGVEITLEAHSRSVGAASYEDAKRAGLPAHMARLVGLAGFVHDFGKADPRFQAELHGSPFAATASAVPLAKSRRLPHFAETGRRRGFAPSGFRHEALSIPLALRHPEVSALTEDERDLLTWLVGTHHGYGRPFFPSCADPEEETLTRLNVDGVSVEARAKDAPIRLDQGWFELGARVRRRFGPWELARLEAILRLADHRVSAAEQERGIQA